MVGSFMISWILPIDGIRIITNFYYEMWTNSRFNLEMNQDPIYEDVSNEKEIEI
jgi:hypothetical protein